ncbi:MAG: hypothetical protein Q8934_17165 [Bacillota bacterium]|nr:hypothetical protein [Bacillota bacterium]
MPQVKLHSHKMIFGWENDNGTGEMLIQQILKGEKTATCAPKEQYSEIELKETYEPVGEVVTVCDKEGNARCNVRLIGVFETTFGHPDLRLVSGEGDGDNLEKFKHDHLIAWQDSGIDINEDTILIVELFELVKD